MSVSGQLTRTEVQRRAGFGLPNLFLPIAWRCVCRSQVELSVAVIDCVERNRKQVALMPATLPSSYNETRILKLVLCEFDLALAAPASQLHDRPCCGEVAIVTPSILREKIKQERFRTVRESNEFLMFEDLVRQLGEASAFAPSFGP